MFREHIFSRRINRPTYSDLNPVRWYTDQYFYYAGNPALVPELAWLLSTAFTFHRKYIITATYGFRENYMAKRLIIDSADNAVKSQTANFSNMQRFDLLFSAHFNAGPWSMQTSAGVNYSRYPFPQIGKDGIAARWAANAQVQQQLKIPAGLRLELATYFYSRELWGIYLKEPLFFMDAGLRKSFLKDKPSVLNTGLFDFEKNRQSVGWIEELNKRHTPETEEYGITSFVFRSRRPFHPRRFWQYLNNDWHSNIIRSKGVFWIASRPGDALNWSQAGGSLRTDKAGVWWCSMPFGERIRYASFIDNQKEIETRWDKKYGDRYNEIVLIGQYIDKRTIYNELENCLCN